MLHHGDIALLSKYFALSGRDRRSVAGAQIDAISMFSDVPRYVDAETARAKSELRTRLRESSDPAEVSDILDELRDMSALTARPTAESREYAREDVDDDLLILQGLVGRRLHIIERSDPLSVRVLEAVHGDDGAAWASGPYTTLGGAFCLTRDGAALLAQLKRTSNLELPDQKRMLNAAADRSVKMRKIMDAINIQANALYERACKSWIATAPKMPAATGQDAGR